MATHLITPNETAAGIPGGETSVLLLGGRAPRLIIANQLIPRLFDEVRVGVRALPRVGAEVGGLLVGPKGHAGGVLVDDIVPIPIEYRFGPSYRLSSPDLAKIEEAIGLAHEDPSKTVVGFYRSRTRGGAKFRDSDQEFLMAVELAHARFAKDFHFFFVLSPPARSEMALGVALRNRNNWSDFRPFTCHADPPSVTSDLGDPEPMEIPTESEISPPNLKPESTNVSIPEFVAEQPEARNDHNHEPAKAEPETMKTRSESVMVETEELYTDIHEPANADMESMNGDGHSPAKAVTKTPTSKTASNGHKKAKASAKPETAARPRAKKTTTTAKPKARIAQTGTAAHAQNTEPKVKPHAATAAAIVAEPKLVAKNEPKPAVQNLAKIIGDQIGQAQRSQVTPRPSRRYMLWAAGIVAVAALATGGYFLVASHSHRVAPPAHTAAVAPTKQPLALTAEKRGTDLVLSWNRESSSVTLASYGMLIIRGKDGRRDISLTPDQLRAGSIVYTPTTDQIEVELSVVAGEHVTKDSVIVSLPHKGGKNAIVTTAADPRHAAISGCPPGLFRFVERAGKAQRA